MFVVIIIQIIQLGFELQNRGYQVNLILFTFSYKANLNFKSCHQLNGGVCVFKKIQIFGAFERKLTCRKT